MGALRLCNNTKSDKLMALFFLLQFFYPVALGDAGGVVE